MAKLKCQTGRKSGDVRYSAIGNCLWFSRNGTRQSFDGEAEMSNRAKVWRRPLLLNRKFSFGETLGRPLPYSAMS